MADIFDYLNWRGDLGFDVSPLNEVDSYALCKLGCPDFTGIIPENGSCVPLSRALEGYLQMYGEEAAALLGPLASERILPVMSRMTGTARFRDVALSHYVNHVEPEMEKQFSAVTARLPDGTRFVTFRGTDDSLTAWRENLNMGLSDCVPSHSEALDYLLRVTEDFEGGFWVGGHSKGGNLAVYAAANAPEELQERIIGVWNFDGPGFRTQIIATPGYERIRRRLRTLLPQHAIVGMLLFHSEEYEIVESAERGFAAHDGFKWLVEGTSFVRCNDLALSSRVFGNAFVAWAAEQDEEQRIRFVNSLFSALTATGATTVSELSEHRFRQAFGILRRMWQERGIAADAVNGLEQLMKEYLRAAGGTIPIPRLPKPKLSSIRRSADKNKDRE